MKKIIILFLTAMICISIHGQANDKYRLKYNNPDLIVDLGVGLWGMPIPIDYDGDGLMDLLMTCPSTPHKGIFYFHNIGNKQTPLFDKGVKLVNTTYRDLSVSYVNGNLHVIHKGVEYLDFKNSLFARPQKIEVTENPLKDIVKERGNTWAYVDYDNDGDLDIIVGLGDWGDYGWDNAYDKNGNWKNGPLHGYVYLLENKNGEYINRGKIKAGKKAIDVYGAPTPNMYDFDGDGDLDLICGEFIDKLTWFENIGTREVPRFAEGRYLENKDGIIKFHIEMILPVAVDFDKDGNIDLMVGDEDGRVAYLRNTGIVIDNMPQFDSPVYLQQKADCVKYGALSTPFSVDWDNDGLDDIISGNSAGNICFIKNLGGGNDPICAAPVNFKVNGEVIRILAGKNGSIQGPCEEKWGYTTVSVADWDGDGKKDIIANSIFGEIVWYKNTGDVENLEGPYLVKVDWQGKDAPKPLWNWWNPGKTDLVTQWRTTPFAIDWNQDGFTDLILMDHEGYLCFYERFKMNDELWLKPGKRIFATEGVIVGPTKKHDPIVNEPGPLRLNDKEAGASGRRKLCLVDWNNDGRLDLIVNTLNAAFLENVRQSGDTIYFKNQGDLSRLSLAGHTTSPTPVDWDKDGIYDLLVGAEDGFFYIIKNKTIKK